MRLLKALATRRELKREFSEAQKRLQMLTNTQRRPTLPWDIALASLIIAFVVSCVFVVLKIVGLL